MRISGHRRYKLAVSSGFAPAGQLFNERSLIDRVRHLLGQKHGTKLYRDLGKRAQAARVMPEAQRHATRAAVRKAA
jgi:hypothetical protein